MIKMVLPTGDLLLPGRWVPVPYPDCQVLVDVGCLVSSPQFTGSRWVLELHAKQHDKVYLQQTILFLKNNVPDFPSIILCSRRRLHQPNLADLAASPVTILAPSLRLGALHHHLPTGCQFR